MGDQSGPESSNFSVFFESALEEYERETGKPLAQHPLAELLERCSTVESVSHVLQEQARGFHQSINSRITKSLNSIVSILYTLSTTTAIRNALNAHFPPATLIFAALAILLGAAKDVRANHGELADILELAEQSVNRLEIYTKVTLERAMVKLIVEMMVQLLHVLGLVTKAIERNYWIKIGKKLLGDNDIEVALQKLDQLSLFEGQMIAAQILKLTDGLVQEEKASRELLQQMASDANKSKRDKLARNIKSWLSPPDPWKNQNEINELRHAGTAAWFLDDETFSKWKWSEQGSLLWIQGKPGAGKSVLCSAIIQDIDTMRKSNPAALMFFYFDFKEEQKRDLRGLLSSLLVQLCHQSDSYYDLLSNLFLEHESGSRHASDAALLRCLKDILKLPREHPIYLVVDALDECLDLPVKLSPRKKVLNFLEELVGSKNLNLRICVTSRPESDITVVLDRLTCHTICLHDERRQINDINDYITWFVNNDEGMQEWTTEDKQHVIDVLTRKAGGMFRWVDCQLPYLRECPWTDIEQVLNELPETLNGTYERILGEIKGVHKELAHRLFQCIAAASRPLRVEELAEIFAFDFRTDPIPKFREDRRRSDPLRAVLSTCSSLLAVVNVEGAQVIQFSHLSVEEFLTSNHLPKSNHAISYYHVSMTPAHTLVARACLGILLHLPKDVTRDSLQRFHLAEYAAEHWVDHVQFKDVSEHVEDGMKCLFDPSKSHLQVWVWIHDPEVPSWRRHERASIPLPLRGTPLHYVALCGLHNIVESLITEHSQRVDSQGFEDNETPLHSASSRGYIEVAQVLLKHSAIATSQNRSGSTPLHQASYWGHVDVACLLIEHGAVATAQDLGGLTPLHEASSSGQVEVAWLLIEHGAVATAQNERGLTPLHQASSLGGVEVAWLLIEHGAVATAQDKSGSTPLHWASSQGDADVAWLLIEHGADATAQDKSGSTPLHEASCQGHIEVAWLLIEYGAITTAQDGRGSTPLHEASCQGHLEVASLLIEHGAVVTAQDGSGSTPLHDASGMGHIEVVWLLIEHGAVTTAQDERGWTPLHRASSNGHIEVARLLIEHGAATTAQDRSGWTPLHWASGEGHIEVARLLIEHGAVTTAQDRSGWTPLHHASFYGHAEVARLLIIEHGAVTTAQDGRGWTPLHQASSGGHVEVARLLIEHGAVMTAQDMWGWAPLHQASHRGHTEVVRLLIEHGAVATAEDKSGSTPLHWVSPSRQVEVARLLIEHGAVATAHDKSGSTPLHRASSSGQVEVARLLIEHGAVATAQDGTGSTPLHWASSRGEVELARLLIRHGVATAQVGTPSTLPRNTSDMGHVEVARLLIEHGAVATAQDESGWTPLHWASSSGDVEVARLLFEHGAVATAQDGSGSTPLHQASFRGQVEVAQLLIEHGAVATAQDGSGSTPLRQASNGGHVELIRLLDHGVVTTAQDGDRQTQSH